MAAAPGRSRVRRRVLPGLFSRRTTITCGAGQVLWRPRPIRSTGSQPGLVTARSTSSPIWTITASDGPSARRRRAQTIIRHWDDLLNSRRRQPHFIHHIYQVCDGTRLLTRRLVALFRLVQPEAVFSEWPVFAEGYWSWETGFDARCMNDAYFAAGDPDQFPELAALGLEPWQPAELYTKSEWYNVAWGLRGGTHVLVPRDGPSLRLANRRAATERSGAAWEGLMDRKFPTLQGGIPRLAVHLVHRAREGRGLSWPELNLEVEPIPAGVR